MKKLLLFSLFVALSCHVRAEKSDSLARARIDSVAQARIDSLNKARTDTLVRKVNDNYKLIYLVIKSSYHLQSDNVRGRLDKISRMILPSGKIQALSTQMSAKRYERKLTRACSRMEGLIQRKTNQTQKKVLKKLDKKTYELEKAQAKSLFEERLQQEHPDWYDLYVTREGQTPYSDDTLSYANRVRQDTRTMEKILSSSLYVDYLKKKESSYQKMYEPYFKLHTNENQVVRAIRAYNQYAVKLFKRYQGN